MKLPRPTRTTMIFSLCLIALASVLAYENHQLSLLTNRLETTANKDSLDAILTRLAKVDVRLDAVDGKHLVTNDDFRSGQQALSNRIDAVQAYAKQASKNHPRPLHARNSCRGAGDGAQGQYRDDR